ncbi:MAG TPA: dihydrolipoamide acetyltransferase family protein, partial [Candidatus Binatia bacterium]|nr:dihydrolipoamide acetyltransferase family protein [Candidatus Binatia bacterium]
MATNVIMPALGVAQQTGTLLKWFKAEGQSVSKGEPLMEIETDKATVEIEAPGSGVLANVTAVPGDEIPVGNRIAVILAPGEAASVVSTESPHSSPLPKGKGTKPQPAAVQDRQALRKPPLSQGEGRGEGPSGTFPPHHTNRAVFSVSSGPARLLASPRAKRLAREKGIDLTSLKGSGPEGSILAEDVLRAAPDRAPPTTARAQQIHSLTPMRRIVGERMRHSKQTAPHFYLSMDIDMSAVSKWRWEWKEGGQDAPSINDFILHACARTLKDFPAVNSSFTDEGIELRGEINLGMAVALEEGLVVPVIRNADRLSLTELAAQSRALVDKAQKKKLFPLDYEGGTFTVSNLGMLGVDSFTAIINPPQCAILAVGQVAPRVVADGGMFAIKPLMTATLSADHR